MAGIMVIIIVAIISAIVFTWLSSVVVKAKGRGTDIADCYHDIPYGITQCYLPPSSGDFLAFTPAEAGTSFSDTSTSFSWDKGGKVAAARWQITLCDPIWHVISCGGEVRLS